MSRMDLAIKLIKELLVKVESLEKKVKKLQKNT